MVAFERAIEIGVDALELDVHLTRDGVFVCAHDPNASRMAGAPLAWRDLDVADTQRLDIGWGFLAADGTRPFAGRGISVPRFEEVLTTYPIHINVDIKGDPSAVDPMLELVRKHKAEDRVTLACFSSGPIVALRRKGYGGETALSQTEVATLLAMPAVLWRQLPFTGNAAQVPIHQGPVRFDRATFTAKCHSLGLRVDYWTVDDPKQAARLLELGADGIMTNDPAALKPLFTV
jgi:glycerophosphoryl diester phosphodiesterase